MTISGYGSMIALGIVASGALAWVLARRFSLNFYDILILAVYGLGFGIVGAKLFYLLINISYIRFDLLLHPEYVGAMLRGGFVFYGGIPFGLAGIWLGGRIHHIDPKPYFRCCLPVIPLTHGFGRIGCFLAGCCYGIPYSGPFAVTYHSDTAGLTGVALFPVQLLEALAEFAICALLLALVLYSGGKRNLLALYLLLYGSVRFFLEFLRYDAERGHLLWFSTSQWVSLFIILCVILYACTAGRKTNRPSETQ